MSASFAAARDFVYANARILDRRRFDVHFAGGPRAAVVAAVRAYRNSDGGLGHALEADKRAPESQPLDVAVGLDLLHEVGAVDEELALGACDFLATVADERGLVPYIVRSALEHPRANHWTEESLAAGLGPALGIAGVLHAWGVHHPWLARATATCLDALEREPPDDAHVLREAFQFVESVPAARQAWPALAEALRTARWVRRDPESPEYGLTPFEFAPAPGSPQRSLFGDEEIEAHLVRLERDQQPDGGWPLSWEPPGAAATLEWRGDVTVRALRVLSAYGRLPSDMVPGA
jgi:hypothetical protein